MTSPASTLPHAREFVTQGPAGTGTHLLMTAVADALSEAGYGGPPAVTVAGGLDGGEAVIHVAHGGPGVLGSCTPAYLTTPVVHGFPETWRDLTPIAQLVADSYLLVAPAGTAADACELFSRPTSIVIPKAGGNSDIQAMLLRNATRGEVQVLVEHDPVKLRSALTEGGADWATGVYSDFAPQLADGRLEVLATFDAAPVADAIAPTLRQQGIDVAFPLWRGVIAPGGLTDADVAAWDAALRVAITMPAWQAYVRDQRQRTEYLDAAAFTDVLAGEDVRYRAWLAALDG